MKAENIEDIYGLSAVQEGILLDELAAPEAGRFVTQCVTNLQGKLNTSALFQACQDVVARHTALRTSIHWQNLNKPLQVVRRQVKLPITEEDWRHLSHAEQEQELQAFLETDRRHNFDLSCVPLMRLKLIRRAEHTYQLISSHHHVLLDGWSVSLLLNEILHGYEARRCGTRSELPASRPYRDFIKWLRQQDLTQAEAYWRAALEGFTSPTPLAIDRPHRMIHSERGLGQGIQEIQLSQATTNALQQLARQHQLTLNTIVQGAWALLLSRYSRSQDIVFGVTSSVRPVELAAVEQMVGLFINTLPMRVQVRGKTRLPEWLRSVQRQMVEMRPFEHTPPALVQSWSEVERRQPLFKSILVFENYPVKSHSQQPEHDAGLEVTGVRTIEQADHWLTLTVVPDPQLTLRLGYGLRLGFDDEAVARMASHLQTILEAMVSDPARTLDEIPSLTRAERHQLLVERNKRPEEPQRNRCLHELFEARVRRAPDAVAVVLEDEELTYDQLNRRANQLAHYLRRLGVGPEVRVGICVERSMEMVVALLGILKAGGAYVPLDAATPPERLSFILKDADIEVLLTQPALVESLALHPARVVCLDPEWEELAQESTGNPQQLACPQNLAYIIYTSGSTGKPKGVLLSHQNVVDYTLQVTEDFRLAATDRVLQFASLSFDVAIEEIFPTLASGATLVLTRAIPAVKDFRQFIEQAQLTVFELPTAFWHEWIYEMSVIASRLPESVRMVIVGGEEISAERFAAWQQFAGQRANLVHVFGLTETSVTSTTYHVEKEEEERERSASLPIGRPLANTEIYVLDERLEPVPVGIVGELYIGGNGLARGYLKQAELTAETFIPHPFCERKGARLYKTGDFVRYLPDGNLEFVGRIDEQVKIRGFRIELGEIAAAVTKHPAVRDAVIVVRKGETSDRRLVAYLVSGGEDKLSASEIRLFLREKLPEHMIPNAFVQLDELPLTLNGKIDRRALPDPCTTQMESSQSFIAPQTKLERDIAAIWQEVLQLEKVGRHDDFFELGGHSLLLMQIYSKLCERLKKEFSIVELFNHTTVHALAKFMGHGTDEEEFVRQGAASVDKLTDGKNRLRRQFKQLQRQKVRGEKTESDYLPPAFNAVK